MLHKNLASSARWHGKRVAAAVARGDSATAAYERAWWRRMLASYSTQEYDEAREVFATAYAHALVEAHR